MFFDGAESTKINIWADEQWDAIKYKEEYYPEWNLPKFNQYWDLLMPVVEKIEIMKGEGGWYYKVDIINRNEVECSAENTPICYIPGYDNKLKITAVWLAVIEFIKWYNQNKP